MPNVKPRRLLLIRNRDTLSQALDLELLASGAAVDILDIVGSSLEVARGVVAARNEDVVLLS